MLGKLQVVLRCANVVMSRSCSLFASVLLIWNTIRTAMFARRREIEVMKLVGATNWFIRFPFMLEGLLQGLAGAAFGSVLLLLVNADWTRGRAQVPVRRQDWVVLSSPTATRSGVVMLRGHLLGMLVGAVGSATAASRFLDV